MLLNINYPVSFTFGVPVTFSTCLVCLSFVLGCVDCASFSDICHLQCNGNEDVHSEFFFSASNLCKLEISRVQLSGSLISSIV